jgi:N-succinyldiaminopimelate aminotransferase
MSDARFPAAGRLAGFGTTIFTEMSALAERTGSINLGQGFPDEDGPPPVLEAAVQAIRAGHNQYAPLPGVPALVDAIAEHQRARYGLEHEAIQVTFGATEAITAALLGLCDPGDEVVALDPFYDSYRAGAALAGARLVGVPLAPPEWRFDPAALARAISGRTRVLLLNTPHNPTGRVLDRAELEQIAAACVEHDLIAISDEVYEHLVFEGEHVPLATLPRMAERTLTISSIGKTFSVTGWKTGWACGPAELVAATRGAKQFMTFAGGTPFQHAAAGALAGAEEHGARLAAQLKAKRDRICAGLERAGATVLRPAGTYFVNADVRPLGYDDGVAFCRELPERAGVVAIPTSVFCGDAERARSLVRFAFCKREEVIDEAAGRLERLRSG